VTVNGTYVQAASGTFDASIADGGNFGRVAATNAASLNGNLTVSPAPGFIPSSGSTFEVLSASAINGQFTQPQFTGFDPGLQLEVAYGSTNVSIQATRLYPLGDADQDGDVDQADYGVWRSTFGSNDRRADFNGNGTIDAVDYVLWRNALGALSSSASLNGVGVADGDSATPNAQASAKAEVASSVLGSVTPGRSDSGVASKAFDQALANWPTSSLEWRAGRTMQAALSAVQNQDVAEADALLNFLATLHGYSPGRDQPSDYQDAFRYMEPRSDGSQLADDFFAEVGEHPNDLSAEIAALHE
jgi:hypothetical protein